MSSRQVWISLLLFSTLGLTPLEGASAKEAGKAYSCHKLLHPANFFYGELDQLEEALEFSQDPKTLVDYLVKNDIRGIAFQLQALSRFYKNRAEFFKLLRFEFKDLEDALGDYSLTFELLEAIQEGSFPAEFLEFMRAKSDQAFIELVQYLEREHWIQHSQTSKIEDIRSQLDAFKFKKAKKERKFVFKRLGKKLRFAKKKIAELEDFIFQEKYDYNAMEFGLHAFRRAARWPAIYIQAAMPLFHIEHYKGSSNSSKASLIKKYRGKPFTVLSPSSKNSQGVPELPYYQISEAIDFLGVLKDQAEAQHYLTKGWIEFIELQGKPVPSEEDARQAVISRLSPKLGAAVEQQTQRFYRLFTEEKSLKALREALE